VRPTTDRVREAWMASLGSAVEGARVLDLFSGSGALGLEALSRGANSVTFVEQSRAALQALRSNVDLLGAGGRCRIVRGDAMAFVRRLDPVEPEYDLALADPPYAGALAVELLLLFMERPFAESIWIEHRKTTPVPSLPGLRQRRYGDTTLSILTRSE
jgi:16S rRNA (guanine966-N2)-methyltransferase